MNSVIFTHILLTELIVTVIVCIRMFHQRNIVFIYKFLPCVIFMSVSTKLKPYTPSALFHDKISHIIKLRNSCYLYFRGRLPQTNQMP